MARKSETTLAIHAQLSALADGELPAHEIGALLDAMDADPQAHLWWTEHHATQAAVRGESVASASGELAFWEAVQKQLVHEPGRGHAIETPNAVALADATKVANDPWWKSMRLASVAGLLSVGVVAAMVWSSPKNAELAAVPAAAPVLVAADADSVRAGVMLRDPALDALMAAHQQMGGHSAWQTPSGFLRNATFETSGR